MAEVRRVREYPHDADVLKLMDHFFDHISTREPRAGVDPGHVFPA
jgi:hypothetical protein